MRVYLAEEAVVGHISLDGETGKITVTIDLVVPPKDEAYYKSVVYSSLESAGYIVDEASRLYDCIGLIEEKILNEFGNILVSELEMQSWLEKLEKNLSVKTFGEGQEVSGSNY